MAHNEPPHQDLHRLQIELFASLVLKKLINECIVKHLSAKNQITKFSSTKLKIEGSSKLCHTENL